MNSSSAFLSRHLKQPSEIRQRNLSPRRKDDQTSRRVETSPLNDDVVLVIDSISDSCVKFLQTGLGRVDLCLQVCDP